MSLINRYFNEKLPGEWRDQSVYTLMGPDDSGVQHLLTFVVDTEVSNYDLEEFARERIDIMLSSLQSADVLKDEQKTLANGRTVHELVYKWVPVDGKIIFQKVVYMLIDGTGYSFSANFSKKTIRTIGVEVERIINSFSPTSEESEVEE